MIDRSQDDLRSTSEGQSYALFFALVDNDQALFDRILEATTNPAREWRGEIALTLAGQQRLLLVRTARLGESAANCWRIACCRSLVVKSVVYITTSAQRRSGESRAQRLFS